MLNLALVDGADPILREEMPAFNFKNSIIDPIELAKALTKFMVDNGGVGLAANQVGLRYRLFVMKAQPNIAFFNPTIIDKTTEEIKLDEACLSYPGITVPVTRPSAIKVRYTYPNGEVRTDKFIGLSARIVQHEIDHLNGVKFTDYLSKLELERLLKKTYKREGKALPLKKFL